jgi:transcription elongation factor Elf1
MEADGLMPYMDDWHKFTCPGCNATTSDVARGYREEGKCPTCGLSQEVLYAVWRVRESHATANVKEEYEAMAVRAGKAEAEVARLTRRLESIKEAVEGGYDH